MSTQKDEDPVEAFDWALEDIINKPPYSHRDMVLALGRGQFYIEGHQSNYNDALYYAHAHDTEESWEAVRALDRSEVSEIPY